MSATMSSSVEPKRLHPAWIFYSALLTLRALALPILISLISSGGLFQWLSLAISFVIMAIIVAFRSFAWTRLSYEASSEGIRVHSGILSRQERFLPLDRIQSIDLNETIIHRLLRVTAVKIESAAGAGQGADISLEALSHAEANRLRELLLPALVKHPATEPAGADLPLAVDSEKRLIAAFSTKRLLAAGATSANVAPALGVVFGLVQFADDLLPGQAWDRVERVASNATVLSAISVAIGGVILAWLAAILVYSLTYANFELWEIDGRLHATYGLLERRRVSFPPGRIQAVTLTEGLLRQPFGLVAVSAESAGYGSDSGVSGTLFPLLRRDEVMSFLMRAVPAYATDPFEAEFAGPPIRARRRYLTEPAMIAGVLAAVILSVTIFVPRIDWEWGLLGLLLFPCLLALGLAEFRDTGWMVQKDGRLVFRERPFERKTTVTHVRRIQLRSTSQSILQRRAGLATFSASVASGGAGGRIQLGHLDAATASALLDRLTPHRASLDLIRLTTSSTRTQDSVNRQVGTLAESDAAFPPADDVDSTERLPRSE